jgi:RHS repeat-associated protein
MLMLALSGLCHAQSDTVTYVYTDPQGTPLAKADASGNIVARYDYTPYGNSVASLGNPPNGPGYTGHVNDPETGLVYMQARYYQPTGRFLSPDPVGPTAGNLYSFNRYAYANNNPVVNIDTDGRETGPAYHAEFVMMGATPQTYISPNDTVGPAISTGASFLPIISDGVNIGNAFTNPSASNIAVAVAGALPIVGAPAAKAIKAVTAVAEIPGKGAVAGEAVQLAKKLASESQLAELGAGGGTVTHGAGTAKELTQADRLAGQYGGKASDYQKVSSSSYTASDGSHVETHAYRDSQSGQVVEPKTIVNPAQQQ